MMSSAIRAFLRDALPETDSTPMFAVKKSSVGVHSSVDENADFYRQLKIQEK